MAEGTLTSKGQITLPKQVRDDLGLHPGDRILFRRLANGLVVLEPRRRDLRSLRGRFKAKGMDIEAAIASGRESTDE
jgi:AbrB family looped-hinge helix DNA binding protein